MPLSRHLSGLETVAADEAVKEVPIVAIVRTFTGVKLMPSSAREMFDEMLAAAPAQPQAEKSEK